MSELAQLAAAIADPSRAAMLDVLLDGRDHSIGALGRHAGVAIATASSHVHKLADARLVTVTRAGRERRVRLASAEVAQLLEQLAVVASQRTRRDELRFARTCYDHLAGVLAIVVVDALVDRGWLHRTSDNLEPAPTLFAWLSDHGHAVEIAGKRPLSRACLDWTESTPHVAGRIGAALAAVFVDERWVAPVRASRALRVTARGRAALARELGVVVPFALRG